MRARRKESSVWRLFNIKVKGYGSRRKERKGCRHMQPKERIVSSGPISKLTPAGIRDLILCFLE